MSSSEIPGNNSVDKSSLQNQDEQQISFFVLRSPVDYSDRRVETAELKVLDFQFLKVLGSVRLPLRLCTILIQ